MSKWTSKRGASDAKFRAVKRDTYYQRSSLLDQLLRLSSGDFPPTDGGAGFAVINGDRVSAERNGDVGRERKKR